MHSALQRRPLDYLFKIIILKLPPTAENVCQNIAPTDSIHT